MQSILAEKKADYVDLRDTLFFIQDQESTGLWGTNGLADAQPGEMSDAELEKLTFEKSSSVSMTSLSLPPIPGALSIGPSSFPDDEDAIMENSITELVAVDDEPITRLSVKLREASTPAFWEYANSSSDFGNGLSLDEILLSLRYYLIFGSDTRFSIIIFPLLIYQRTMRHAAVVSERVIGLAAESTVKILLEVLRLLIRASTWFSEYYIILL